MSLLIEFCIFGGCFISLGGDFDDIKTMSHCVLISSIVSAKAGREFMANSRGRGKK